MEVFTKSARETQNLGEKLANNLSFGKLSLKKGVVIALYGDLGSGKTTFIQGLAKGLGIKKRILSPTFIMMRDCVIYDTQYATHKRQFMSRVSCHLSHFYHVDLYRIQNEKDVEGLGLSEIWLNPENIVAIEWAEKIEKLLPKKRIDIYFEYVSESERKISL